MNPEIIRKFVNLFEGKKKSLNEGYEGKILTILDQHHIDAHFENGSLVVYDQIDVNRVEDVLMNHPGIQMPEVRVEDESAPQDYDDSMDGDFDSGMASAGLGTDEDYGDYGSSGYEESVEKTDKSNAYIQGYKDGFKRKPQDYGMKNREYQTGYEDGKKEHDDHGMHETRKLGSFNSDGSYNTSDDEAIDFDELDFDESMKTKVTMTKEQKKALKAYEFALRQEDRYMGSVFANAYGQRQHEAKVSAAHAECKRLGMTHEYGTLRGDLITKAKRYESDEDEKVEEAPELLKDYEFNDPQMWDRAVQARGLQTRVAADVENGPSPDDIWNYAYAQDEHGDLYGHWGPDEAKSDPDSNNPEYSGVLFKNSDDYLNYIHNSDAFDKDDGQFGNLNMEAKHRNNIEQVIETIEHDGSQVYKVKTAEGRTTLSIRHPDGKESIRDIAVEDGVEEDLVRSMHRQWNDYVKEVDVNKPTSYRQLSDAGPKYAPGNSEVWYWKQEYSRDFMMGPSWIEEKRPELMPSAETIGKTHSMIGTLNTSDLEDIYMMMQGENWSPQGEARGMIERSGTGHTSMSMGDAVRVGTALYIVDSFGFKRLGEDVTEKMSESRGSDGRALRAMGHAWAINAPPKAGVYSRSASVGYPNDFAIIDKHEIVAGPFKNIADATKAKIEVGYGKIVPLNKISPEMLINFGISLDHNQRPVGEATFGTKYKHTPAELAQIKGWENAMDLKFKNPYDHSQPELRDAYIKGYMAARRKQKRIGFGRIADLPNRKLTREGNLNTQEAKKPAAKNSNTESLKLVIDGSDVGFEGEDYYYDGDNIIANDRRIAGKILRAINTSGLFSKQAVVVKNGEQPVIGFDALADARSVFQDTIGTDEFPMDVEIKTDSTNKFYIYTNGKRNVRTFDKFPHAKRYIKKLDQQLQDQSGPERMEV